MDAVYKIRRRRREHSRHLRPLDHNKFCVERPFSSNCEAKEDWTRVKAVVDACVAADPARLKQAEGRKVFEVKPRVAWDKGKALSYLLSQLGLEGKYDAGEVLSQQVITGGDKTREGFRGTGCDGPHQLRGAPCPSRQTPSSACGIPRRCSCSSIDQGASRGERGDEESQHLRQIQCVCV